MDNSKIVTNFASVKLKQQRTMREININGRTYTLNQCTDDLHDWCHTASVGEYTHYYNQIVFKNQQGVYACYTSNLSNIREI